MTRAKRDGVTDEQRATEMAWDLVRPMRGKAWRGLSAAQREVLRDALWFHRWLIVQGMELGRALATKGGGPGKGGRPGKGKGRAKKGAKR